MSGNIDIVGVLGFLQGAEVNNGNRKMRTYLLIVLEIFAVAALLIVFR